MVKNVYCRKIILAVCILVVISILLFSQFNVIIHRVFSTIEKTLLDSFKTSGTNYVNSDIDFITQLDNRFKKADYLNIFLNDISKAFLLKRKNIVTNNSDILRKIEVRGVTNTKESVTIIVEFLGDIASDGIGA